MYPKMVSKVTKNGQLSTQVTNNGTNNDQKWYTGHLMYPKMVSKVTKNGQLSTQVTNNGTNNDQKWYTTCAKNAQIIVKIMQKTHRFAIATR